MPDHYDINWLLEKFDTGQALKFLFFWGHTNNTNDDVGKFGFSQWFESAFIVDGIDYKTAEHWMMANKAILFEDIPVYEKIVKADKAGEVKELGRQVIGFDEVVWNRHRFDIVKTGNIHKFNQHPKFADFLIKTGDRVIVEASPADKIWGIGLDEKDEFASNPYGWKGENLLGFALMEVRDFLRDFGHFEYIKSPITLPWKVSPNIEPEDMYWRMGKGEDIISTCGKYYNALSGRDRIIFKLSYPPPFKWRDFYGD